MVGMQLSTGSRSARNADSIASRTIQSGGSVGGVKKAGIITFGPTWKRGNMGNYIVRAPQTTPSLAKMLLLTTRNPVQGTRYQVYRRGGLM